MSSVTLKGSRARLLPRRYHDGEQYFYIDWEQIKPESCNLDYDCQEDHKGIYAEIYDTNTGTVVARTRSYPVEQYSETAAERILEHLRNEYYFEEDYIWTRKNVKT